MEQGKSLIGIKQNYYLRAFLWGVALAALLFVPWMVYSGGYFFFYGDFNVQQIPFYQMIHDSIRDGNLGWSYTTDLGANIIGSYSFYMLGSPFFWLTLPFPSEAVPYLMAPLLMLKFGFASLGAYTFLRRYVRNQSYAVIGGLLYAFSGFGIYNVFFNHFHEAMITFPFMLAAVDSFIYEKRKGLLGLSVFAAAFVNYYFFAGQAVFIFIYWMVRTITGSYRMHIKEFLRFAFEVLMGFLCASVILVPSILAVLQNSRVNSFPNGWSALAYGNEQRYIHIIISLFFPPDMPAYANFTPDSNAKWASVASWLPLMSMVGVFSFFKLRTHKWLRIFLPLLFVMAMVPVFNSLFQLLNSSYYARWFYMLTLMLSLATVIALDHEETDFKPALKLTFAITTVITLLIGMMPSTTKDSSGVEKTVIGIEKYHDRFWAWVGLAFVGLILLTLLLVFRKKRITFMRLISFFLSAMIVLYGNVLIGTGVVNSNYKADYITSNALGNKDAFDELEDLHAVRSDFYNEMDNMGMFWQIPTIQAFQSIVPGSIMEFYNSVGVERSVGSRPDTDHYGVRGVLSCKYLFDNNTHSDCFANSDGTNKMPGWTLIADTNGYYVYQNDYYIPFGFTYDTYITEEEFNNCFEDDRSLLMLKSMVLTPEQAAKYSDILVHDDHVIEYRYTQNEYYEDCRARQRLTCSSVVFGKNTITAEITTGDSSELVFFSIPYEKGWTATVNGAPAEIEKVNVGFMAVRVSGNSNSTIQFTYHTPGLLPGIAVTVVSAAIFIAYLALWKAPGKRRKTMHYAYDDYGAEPYPTNKDIFEQEQKPEENPYTYAEDQGIAYDPSASVNRQNIIYEAPPEPEQKLQSDSGMIGSEITTASSSGAADGKKDISEAELTEAHGEYPPDSD